jgi:uncharacterized membrane protein
MIKHFTSKLLRGFVALFPLLLSLYILIWLFQSAESLAARYLLFFLPDQVYIPGLGIIAMLLFIYTIGSLIDKPGVGRVLQWVEGPFQILPLVRSLYQAIKDFTAYLSPQKKRHNRVVAVTVGDGMEVIGLVTRESLQHLPVAIAGESRIAVYLPMSYQFGGYTVFMDRARVREIPMSTESALRSVLTAWVSGGEPKNVSDHKPIQ